MPTLRPCLVILAIVLFALSCQKDPPGAETPAAPRVQEPAATDPENLRADSLLDALQYNKAISLFQTLETRYAEQGLWAGYIACRRKRAYCLWASRESEKAVALCQETLPEAQEKLGVNHPEVAKLYTILGNVHADKRTEADFEASLDYYHRALSIRKQIYGSQSPELGEAYERLGMAYWLIDDYADALPFYEKALSCQDSLSAKNFGVYRKVYNNLGLNYYSMGYFSKALVYFEKAGAVNEKFTKKRDSKAVKYLINMAQAHNSLGDPDAALDLFREAQAIEAETGEPDSELKCMILGGMGDSYTLQEDYGAASTVYRQHLNYWRPGNRDDVSGLTLGLLSLSKVFLKKNQVDSALQYLQRARMLVEKNYDPTSFNRVSVLNQLGQAYQLRGDVPRSRKLFEEALGIARAKAGEHHPTVGDLKKHLAELALETGALDEALRKAEDARVSFLTREAPCAGQPVVAQVSSLADLIEVLGLQGKIFAAQFDRNKDEATLRQSVDCYRQAIAFSDSLKTVLLSGPARQAAQKQVFNIAENALESLYRLWSIRPAPEYLEQAFFFMEKSKAAELLASTQEIDAKHSAGIPEAWLDRETFLKTQLSSYRNWLNAPERLVELSANFQAPLFQKRFLEAKYSLDTFLLQLEKQFPNYHRLKYDFRVVSLPALQRFTARRQVQCLEYFYGKRSIYAFTVLGDTVLWNQLKTPESGGVARESNRAKPAAARDTLDQVVSRFLNLLTDKNRQESDPAAYFSAACFLKKCLLPDSLLSGNRGLVIVPDGRLSALPFEALLTAPHSGSYGTAPYLVRDHSIQYAWSATLLTTEPARQHPEKFLLQVAPFVDTTRDGLPVLPNSLREKPDNASATLLLDAQATADVCLRDAAAFNVLHLSTHAHAGKRSQPHIEFFDRAVSVPEIYAQHLNASLVSLSACQTGAGAYAEGEGVLSLARAFAYAGARSLVASQWSVNERSTADLFAAFYQNLEAGQAKSEALRQAKLQMLDWPGIDARKAPYYWAAFTLSGADGPVDLGVGWPWWVWALGGGVLLTGFFVFFRTRKRS